MSRIIDCLTTGHDWRLTLLAVAVCLLGLSTTLRLINRARGRSGGARRRLALVASAVGALAIWSTHFIAMQGYVAGAPLTYDPILTFGSLLIAIITIGLAFSITAARNSRLWRMTSVMVGVTGVAAMHYLGMAAIRMPADVSWSPLYVAASILVSMSVAGATAFYYRPGRPRHLAMGTAGGALSVVFLHFLGTIAMEATPDPTIIETGGLTPGTMQLLMMATILFVVGSAGVMLLMNFASRNGAFRRIREAVDAMPDGLGFFDVDDRLVLWNARYAEAIPELGPHLKLGMTFRDILQVGIDEGRYAEAAGREDEWIAERMAARRRLSVTMEQQLVGDRWLRVQDRRTAEGGTVTVCTDITDLKRDAQALEEARDEAEAANVAKSQFLANMSHEIRTPLNGVIGLAQALSKTELSPEQHEMLDLMQASGQTLQTLLSDILDLARVESGRLDLSDEPLDLAATVQEAAHLYAENAREKHLGFHVDMDPDAHIWVRGDAVRLKQILTNLISNAVKFTQAGFVGLTVSRGPLDGATPTLRFTVEDTGIGFDAATRDRLFQRFEQADGGITRRFGGSGLGLSICRQLAAMMGGDLDCESEPGGGSAFILTLPLVEVAAPAQTAAVQAASPAPTRAARVLVADDHPTNRRVIELILAQCDALLTVVENGAEALAAFRSADFDLVLMDMQMPVMDGLTATREIRLHEATMGMSRTPIVMLTANAMPEHVNAGKAAGADHHLAKPFNAAELLALVEDPRRLLSAASAAA